MTILLKTKDMTTKEILDVLDASLNSVPADDQLNNFVAGKKIVDDLILSLLLEIRERLINAQSKP